MIKRYIKRTNVLLKDHDEIRGVFNRETNNLEENVKKDTERRCFNSFLSGALTTVLIFGTVLYYFAQTRGEFIKNLIGGIV